MNIYLYIYLFTYVCMNVCMKVDSEWIVPFMSAYVDVRTECQVEDAKFTMLFVSRRSTYRQGRPDIQSVYICMYVRIYVCMYLCMGFAMQAADSRREAGTKTETQRVLWYNNYVCISIYTCILYAFNACMYVCMQWLIVCMLLCCRKRSSFSSIRTAK